MTTGGTELLVVLALAVMLFGPKKLPELARTLGTAMGEYHKATREFENEMKKTTSSIDKEMSSVTTVEPRVATTSRPATTTKAYVPKTQSPTVKEIAKNMGIESANKTDEQLLKEISLKSKKKEIGEG